MDLRPSVAAAVSVGFCAKKYLFVAMHMFNMRLITREDCLRLAFALAD